MDDLDEHRRVLRELISADRDVPGLAAQLGRFRGIDVDPLVVLEVDDVIRLLQRYLDGSLTAEDVGLWAEALEMRDDVDFGAGDTAQAVFDLASEGLGRRPVTPRTAHEMLAELRRSDS